MYLIFTPFSIYYISYTTRRKSIIYLQFFPYILAFKQEEGKKLWIGFTWTVGGK